MIDKRQPIDIRQNITGKRIFHEKMFLSHPSSCKNEDSRFYHLYAAVKMSEECYYKL